MRSLLKLLAKRAQGGIGLTIWRHDAHLMCFTLRFAGVSGTPFGWDPLGVCSILKP